MRRALAALAAAPLLLLPGSAGAAPVAEYGPPFALGPSGGDAWSARVAQEDGRLLIGRAYPVPAVISCGSGAPHAALRVEHLATGPVERVEVTWADGAVEPYTFLAVGLHDGPVWFDSGRARGLAPGTGSLVVPVDWPQEEDAFPRPVTVDVGLQASGACPSASGGTLRVLSVRVTEAAR